MTDYETDPRPLSECLREFGAALNGGRLYGSRRRIATELRTPEATVTHWLNGRGCEQERLVRRAMTMIAAAATPSPA